MNTETGRIYESREAALKDGSDPRNVMELPYTTYVRPGMKVGRNDDCPCGSGKKFKKCCLGKTN